MLDDLLDIEIAYSLLRGGSDDSKDPIDVNYEKLKTDIKVTVPTLLKHPQAHVRAPETPMCTRVSRRLPSTGGWGLAAVSQAGRSPHSCAPWLQGRLQPRPQFAVETGFEGLFFIQGGCFWRLVAGALDELRCPFQKYIEVPGGT